MIAPGIREVRLAHPAGDALPSFVPGSSVLLELPPDRVNAYTLVGPTFEPRWWAVAVREQGVGSRRVHRWTVGDRVWVSAPRSGFAPVLAAPEHLLIAGGIGVTPILAHARWHRSTAGRMRALYVHRPGRGAYREELMRLTDGRVVFPEGRDRLAADLERIIADADPDAHLYTCGPEGLVQTVAMVAATVGVGPERLHSERFTVPLRRSEPFVVQLGGREKQIEVPADRSLLEALESAGIAVENQCRRGVCGRCRLDVVAGAIDHRDLYLSEREKSAGTAIMPCVSRAAGEFLEVAL